MYWQVSECAIDYKIWSALFGCKIPFKPTYLPDTKLARYVCQLPGYDIYTYRTVLYLYMYVIFVCQCMYKHVHVYMYVDLGTYRYM